MSCDRRRVVVTGMGIKSAIGNSLEDYFKSLKDGRCGVKPIEFIDASKLNISVAAYNYEFNPLDYFSKRDLKRTDRFCQMAVAAAKDALFEQDVFSVHDPFKVGVIFGSGIGGISTIEREHENLLTKGPDGVSVFFIPSMILNMAAGLISIETGFKGDNFGVVTACASSSHAIGEAFRKVRDGYLDACLTGGAESGISALTISGFSNLRALTRTSNPERASIPFDLERSGFVMGEGAAVLFLENLEFAKKRGAKIYGEIVGYGATADAFHITKPDSTALAPKTAMEKALKDAEITPEQVGYINAHGTSTKFNDVTETEAIKLAFSNHSKNLLISSTKSMTGHMLGAAGAAEAIATLMGLERGVVFPTIGYEVPDPDCDLNYVPNKFKEVDIDYALSISLGFGGHNSVLCFKKFED